MTRYLAKNNKDKPTQPKSHHRESLKVLKNPVYPKLLCEFDKRTKLCSSEKKTINKLYKKGLTQKKIGRMFNVAQTTISKVVNPNARKKAYARVTRWIINKRKKDLKFKDRMNEIHRKTYRYSYDRDPELRKYYNQKGLKRYYTIKGMV